MISMIDLALCRHTIIVLLFSQEDGFDIINSGNKRANLSSNYIGG